MPAFSLFCVNTYCLKHEMLRQLPPTTLETPNTSIHARFWGFVFWLATMTTMTTHHLPSLLKHEAEHQQPLKTGPLLATMITNAY